MISKQVKDKLRGIIEEHMIPEYKKLMDTREKLRQDIENYADTEFLSPRDLELMAKYPRSIFKTDTIVICDYYTPADKKDGWENFKSHELSYSFQSDLLKIKLSKEIPSICDLGYNLLELRELKKNPVWKKFGKQVIEYMKLKDEYLKKLELTYKFLNHKNTTLTLIRERFPELYELYKK